MFGARRSFGSKAAIKVSMEYLPVFNHLKLLLVDDDPIQTDCLRQALNSFFSLIVVAGSLEQARDLIDGPFLYDVVICDYNLPDGKGLKLLEWIRAKNRIQLPFIVITGEDQLINSQDDLYFGFMTKPTSPQDILFCVSKFYQPTNVFQKAHASIL